MVHIDVDILQTSIFLSAISPFLFSVASAWSRSFVNSFIISSFDCIIVFSACTSANAFNTNSCNEAKFYISKE